MGELQRPGVVIAVMVGQMRLTIGFDMGRVLRIDFPMDEDGGVLIEGFIVQGALLCGDCCLDFCFVLDVAVHFCLILEGVGEEL